MSAPRQRLKNAIVEVSRLSGLPRLLGPLFGGVGAIMALHRVRVASDERFQPNKALEVTPDFLDRTLTHLRERDIDIIGLDEVRRRLQTRDFRRHFVCMTLDDGYADNYLEAFPIFKAHRAPFSIYLTAGFVDRTAFFWWMILEDVIRWNDEVVLRMEGRKQSVATRTLEEKERVFETWHRQFRELSADAVETAARNLCEDYGIDLAAFCAEHAMTWEMAREITDDGLGTIEAHTERHVAVSLLQPDEIKAEMAAASARIAEKTGRAPRHFAFPFGDAAAVTRSQIDLVADMQLKTATMTRAGALKPHHAADLFALPRISLNGYYQSEGYVDLVLSGLPFNLPRI